MPARLFDFGGTVAELIARCEAETGLPPPKPPVFAREFAHKVDT